MKEKGGWVWVEWNDIPDEEFECMYIYYGSWDGTREEDTYIHIYFG